MVRAEREDTGPTVASDEVGSAGADSEIDLLPPASEPRELLRTDFPGATDPVVDHIPKGRRPNRWLLIAIGVLLALLAVDGAGIAANAALSSLYNPGRAVTDYFAAQSRGSVGGMMANATFLPGSDPAFFSSSAVAAMMAVPQNRDLKDVHIISTQSIDYSTETVNVLMTWAGTPRRQAYTVRTDNSRVHELIYHSWRVDIPFATVQLALPNQPGAMAVDNINTASPDPDSVQVIQGYHEVTMIANFAYDTSTRLIDAVGYPGMASFQSTVGSIAAYHASKAVTLAFSACGSADDTCLEHTYSARPGYSWSWELPGYGHVEGTTYRYALVGDPTVGMILKVTTQPGIVTAIGSCASTITINARVYKFRGDWTAKLTWSSGDFTAELSDYCFDVRDDSGTGTV